MSLPRHRESIAGSRRQTLFVAIIALCVFAILATMPLILSALHVHIRPVAATKVHGVKLLHAPKAPPLVALPPVAQPIDPRLSPASPPIGNPAREAALVSSEDARIRILQHAAVRIFQPEVLPVRGSLPTLVLPAGPHPYTEADLAQYGALVRLKDHAALLIDNVFVATNATLKLSSPDLHVLYMDSSTDGFTSIVAWNGNLEFAGTKTEPMTITGWDRIAKTAATDRGFGRSYIREVGGTMTLTNVRTSSLGFWSGRTGGVAWTGLTGHPSTGGATSSTFTNNTYGAFVDRGQNIAFASDLFEFNQLDGLHVHRYSTGTTVSFSSAVRNGDNGFLIGRATQSTVLSDDVAENNESNGFLIDGRPLVSGASASGSAIAPGSGAKITHSDALYNERTGILVEGGSRTVLTSNEVCGPITGIAARLNATNIVITGNDVRCHPRSGLSIGPGAPSAVVSGNAVSGARIAILIRSSGRVEVDNNRLTGATVFGITARGSSSAVSGVGNTISGTGFRAVDARADARTPQLTDTNTNGWQHHSRTTFLNYLIFHPLALLWLSIVVLVLLCYLWSRRKKLPPHPYPASTHWRSDTEGPSLASVSTNGATAAAAHTAPSPVGTVPVGPGDPD
jgi:Right handed beta helix region